MPEYQLTESVGDEERAPFEVTVLPEDTICEAILLEVKEKMAPWKNKEDGSDVFRVEFTFALPDYGNQRVWGDTPTTFSNHPDCTFRNWTQEILGGQELPVGFKLDTETLKDAKVRVRLGYKKYFSKKHNKEVETNFVADVIHARGSAVSVGAASQEEPF